MTVRILRQLLACLFLAGSSSAFARGGPGGALGAMLEVMLVLAIVGGLIAGVFRGSIHRRMPWIVLAFLAVALVAVGMAFPVVGLFYCAPAVVFVAVFASVSDMVQSSLYPAPAVGSLPPHVGRQQPELRAGVVRYILRWIAGSYVFWAAISLFNVELLGFLAVPPLVLVFPKTIGKFLPFILPPLAVAAATGVVVTLFYSFVLKRSGANHYVAPFLFNGCVLFVFLASAEIYRHHLMSQSLLDHVPSRFESSSFLDSVISYRTYLRRPHASLDEEGKTYWWSYSERKFFQVP